MGISWGSLVVGWLFGIIGSLAIEAYKSSRRVQALSKLLKVETDLLFRYSVSMLHGYTIHERAILQHPTHSTKPSRSIYRSNLTLVADLPSECLQDLVELHQLFDTLEEYQTHMAEAENLPLSSYFLYTAMGKLGKAVLLERRLLKSLSEIHGISVSDEELDSLEATYRAEGPLMGGTVDELKSQLTANG